MVLKLKIRRDEHPINPREEYENAGHMVCWHRRYQLGDEQPREQPADWREVFDIENPDAIVLPLYLYDHSGITMSVGKFSCPWDSGQVGWIYLTRKALDENWPASYPDGASKEDKSKIDEERIELGKACLRSEVETYDAFLTGDCWGFELVNVVECDHGDEHEDHIDSCWGFFGEDKDGIFHHLPDEARSLFEDAWSNRG